MFEFVGGMGVYMGVYVWERERKFFSKFLKEGMLYFDTQITLVCYIHSGFKINLISKTSNFFLNLKTLNTTLKRIKAAWLLRRVRMEKRWKRICAAVRPRRCGGGWWWPSSGCWRPSLRVPDEVEHDLRRILKRLRKLQIKKFDSFGYFLYIILINMVCPFGFVYIKFYLLHSI